MDDALALAAAVRGGEVTSVELVERSLREIERADGELNAFVTVCAEQALETARGPLPEGPFTGVPIAIKDLTETAGIRTTFSSRAFADYVPTHDMAVVRRLKEAGFVIVGKTNTPEFGVTAVTESELNGACRNPWDLSRTPGGLVGRGGGRRRRGPGARRTRLRRRRLDSHPRGLLRPRRPEGGARAASRARRTARRSPGSRRTAR